jgi:hypothetical protein
LFEEDSFLSRRFALMIGLCGVLCTTWGCKKGDSKDSQKSSAKNQKDEKQAAAGKTGGKASSAGKEGASYKLMVKAPEPGKVGATVKASVTLEPRGAYKVNMEYPLKLTVSPPESAKVAKSVMQKKDATKMTEKGVVLHPSATLTKAGEHKFSAEFRFSVCTKAQCELKKETLTWVAKAQ